jgi:hypothetical protein
MYLSFCKQQDDMTKFSVIYFAPNFHYVKSRAEVPATIQKSEILHFKVLITNMPHIYFRSKTFLFVKIESKNFQHLYDSRFRETSHNFSSFRQLFFILGHV